LFTEGVANGAGKSALMGTVNLGGVSLAVAVAAVNAVNRARTVRGWRAVTAVVGMVHRGKGIVRELGWKVQLLCRHVAEAASAARV
jgi:hypothetical protein